VARLGTIRLRHGATISQADFSPDGKTLASAGGEFIRLWDVESGRELRRFPGNYLGFSAMAFAPNGELIAGVSGSEKGQVQVYDAKTGRELAQFKEIDPSAIAFSPDSRLLAWSNLSGGIRVRDWKADKEVATLRISYFVGETDFTHALAFAPDGKLLVAGNSRGNLQLWDTDAWKKKETLKHPGGASCLRFSRDGKLLCSAGGLYTPIRLWDVEKRTLIRELKTDRQLNYSVAFSKDAKTLVSHETDGVTFWNIEDGKIRRTIPIRTGTAKSISFSKDDRLLAAAGEDGTIFLFDPATGKLKPELPGHHSYIMGLAAFPDGKSVAVADSAGTICVWSNHDAAEKSPIDCGKTWTRAVTVNSAGTLLAWGGQDKLIRICDARGGKEIRRLEGHQGGVDHLHFAPKTNDLVSGASAGDDSLIIVWDADTGQKRSTFKYEGNSIAALEFRPSGDEVVIAGSDEICLWNWKTKDTRKTPTNHFNGIRVFAASGSGKVGVTVGGLTNLEIRIWDLDERKVTHEFKNRDEPCVAVSPDGSLLALGFGGDIWIWDTIAKRHTRTLRGHVGAVTTLRFLPDGRRLVSGSNDTTILVWDLDSPALRTRD
jgi:WD40 repeat protein